MRRGSAAQNSLLFNPKLEGNFVNMLQTLLRSFPKEPLDYLGEEFQKLHQQYFLGRWEPAQLDGGRFAEAVLRIVEFKNTGAYTPVGTRLRRATIVGAAARNTSLPDSLRFQIPSLAALLLDFRNNRNVAHLGKISVNEMDSSFVINVANWIVAELIRIETKISPEEAQREITRIIERKVPVIEEIGGRLKLLDPKLTAKSQILVFCFQKYPILLAENELFAWVSEKNKTRFRRYLVQLDGDKLIDYHNGEVILTRRGVLWVEKNIKFELEL